MRIFQCIWAISDERHEDRAVEEFKCPLAGASLTGEPFRTQNAPIISSDAFDNLSLRLISGHSASGINRKSRLGQKLAS
jgi:hypothetical protein